MANLFVSFDRGFALAERMFVAGCLAAGCLVLFVNVLMRYLFLMPIPWAEEIALYLCVWLVFIGGSVAVRERGHIAIDLIPHLLSPLGRVRLARAVAAIMLVFFAVFFWYSLQHVIRVKATGQVTPMMQAPMWLAYLAMPVGSLLMAIRTIQIFVQAPTDDRVLAGPDKAEMKD